MQQGNLHVKNFLTPEQQEHLTGRMDEVFGILRSVEYAGDVIVSCSSSALVVQVGPDDRCLVLAVEEHHVWANISSTHGENADYFAADRKAETTRRGLRNYIKKFMEMA